MDVDTGVFWSDALESVLPGGFEGEGDERAVRAMRENAVLETKEVG